MLPCRRFAVSLFHCFVFFVATSFFLLFAKHVWFHVCFNISSLRTFFASLWFTFAVLVFSVLLFRFFFFFASRCRPFAVLFFCCVAVSPFRRFSVSLFRCFRCNSVVFVFLLVAIHVCVFYRCHISFVFQHFVALNFLYFAVVYFRCVSVCRFAVLLFRRCHCNFRFVVLLFAKHVWFPGGATFRVCFSVSSL